MIKRTALTLLFLLAATSLAEDPKAKAAREELERQLTQMVGKQPTKVRVDFIGLEDPNYRVEEASFELDGRNLGSPLLSTLSDEGTHLVWNGDVTPGKHTVKVMVVFSNRASVVLSDEGGYKWKVGGDVSFEVNSGIEVRVQVTPKRDGKQTEVAKRFKLALPAQPVMIAKLDDGSMPDPMARPVIVAEVVDAGTAAPTAEQLAEEKKKAAELAAAEKKQKAADAAEAKKQKAAEAAEAKKQRAAEAAEAKKAAAEAKKQKAAELAEAKRAALAEKKEKAAAALEAKRAAAEEKKRAALEAAEEKKRAAQAALDAKNNPPVVDAGAPVAVAVAEPEVDAGAPEAVDAGAPVEVAVAPVDAGSPAPVAAAPVEDKEGPPWLLIGIAGGVAALIFLIVVARRRSRPPTLDD